MVFDINNLKEAIRDTLRLWLYPECLSGNLEHTLSTSSDTIEISQSFIPYSKYYRKMKSYKNTIPVTIKLRKYGTPDDDIVVSMVTSSTSSLPTTSTLGSYTIAVANVPTSLDTCIASIPLTSMLGSKTEYWLKVTPICTASTVNYYSIGKDSVDTNYWMGTSMYSTVGSSTWTSLNTDIYFDNSIPNYIFTDFPRIDLSIHNYPRVAIDLIGRRTDQRWLNKNIAEYIFDLTVECYSKFPDELDDILSYVDRTLFMKRTDITDIKRVDGGGLLPTSIIKENLFNRAMRYTFIYKMEADT